MAISLRILRKRSGRKESQLSRERPQVKASVGMEWRQGKPASAPEQAGPGAPTPTAELGSRGPQGAQ